MKISASIYSSKEQDLTLLVRQLEELSVDMFHIDCNDQLSVFEDIAHIQSMSSMPIDLHIISPDLTHYTERIAEAGISQVSFQVESLHEGFILPTFANTKVGLAIKIGNPNAQSLLKRYLSQIDYVLLMTTTPGQSGGVFSVESFAVIRDLIHDFPSLQWQIDGGINHEIGYILRLYGVESIVIGSYLMGHSSMANAMLNLRNRMVHSDFSVTDFMHHRSQIPTVQVGTSNTRELLSTMESYRWGVVFCEDQNRQFVGIVTNADVRKELLKGSFDLDESIDRYINHHPKYIFDTFSTQNMLDYIQSVPFPILVLPILNESKELVGGISFHHLIKGN